MAEGNPKPQFRVWTTVDPCANGGLSGMLATCVIQPIDMIKVRIQLGQGSAAQVTKNMLANKGFGSFYKCVCDWDDREKRFSEVESILRRQIKMSILPSVQPFHAIAYTIDKMLALEISRRYAAHFSIIASSYGLPAFAHPLRVHVKADSKNGRLRVGYMSSDFGNHLLSHLMGCLWNAQSREH